MQPDEHNWYAEQEARARAMQTQNEQMQSSQQQMQHWLEEKEKSMAQEQLDLSFELEMIEHLLRGHVVKRHPDGRVEWVEPEDTELIILSEYGIHLIMNTITFYINKNTLLSNYDEETINRKMEDFAEALADTIFMEYEKVFQYPSVEDCKKVLFQRIKSKKEKRVLAYELLGHKPDENKITKQIIDEMEGRAEKEIEKIREQIMKNKLKRFLILIREVQDAVHSTYLRAYAGQERRTLRQHWHISELAGQPQVQQQKRGGGFNPFGWLRR